MLPPKYLSASKSRKSRAPDLYDLDSDPTKDPDAVVGEGATDSEFFHQRFRNFLYVEFVGPRKTLIKLRNLCLDWLQPETHTKEEIVELLVLEQYLTILPERIKPWVRAKRPQSCEKLVTLLERYKEMYEPEDNSSDIHREDGMGRKGAECPPPRSAYFYRDRDRDWDQDWHRDRDRDWDRDRNRGWDRNWDQDWDRDRNWDCDRDRAWARDRAWERDRLRERDWLLERDRLREWWDRRGRSRDLEFGERWPYSRSPRRRFPQRDLSLPLMERTTFAMERGRRRRNLMMEYESQSQDTGSYQDVLDLTEDRKLQNPIQDNMENYRKLLSLGVQLAEDDGPPPTTQGRSRAKRSGGPGARPGLKTMPETKKSTLRRGICEDESSHGVIMRKFVNNVSRNSKSGRARDSNDGSLRFPTRPDQDWKDVTFHKREPLLQERACEGNAFRGGFNCDSDLLSRKRILERKRRYQFDPDGSGSVQEQRGSPRKRPFECSDLRKPMGTSSLSSSSFTESQPHDFRAMPYLCDECGRAFSVISEFVEHQIMHTRENLYEYGESFIHSVAVSEVRKTQARGKRFECKDCGETFSKSITLLEHRKSHSRGYFTECNDEEYEEPFMPSPTFRELQKIYGKDKFYECKVCKETFLHSSALIEHQKKTHGLDDKDDEHGETFKPSPTFKEFQKIYAKEKMYECKVCGEAFRHSLSLKEHQKIHTRANLFEKKGKVCEETFIPGQSLKRRQKIYSAEKLYDFKDGGSTFRQSSDLSGNHKIHSQKSLYESRGYGKSVIHSVPFTESQKSHTITRPPENEDEKAFTISSNPDDDRKFPTKENICERKPNERSVIHSLASAEAQESHSALGPSKHFSKVKGIVESAIPSSSVIERQEVHAEEKASEGKKNERSVIHSLATFKLPRSPSGRECNEKRKSSTYISDLHGKQQKTARVRPYEEGKNNSVIRSVSHTEPPKSLTGQGASEFKLKEDQSSVSNSNAHEHQKAHAKKKNIERKNCETSVIHSLHFGEPETFRPREKCFECPECGESFVRSSDLTEHQKIHHRKKPPGSQKYERSVIRSLASTDPQKSYTEQPVQTSYAQQSVVISYAQQPAQTGDAQQPAQTGDAQQPAQTGDAQQPAQTGDAQQPAQTGDAQQPAQTGDAQQPAQTGDAQQPAQTGDAQQPVQQECKGCGQRFATIEDLGAHQKIYAQEEFHGGKLLGDSGSLDGPGQDEEDRQDEDEQEDSEDTIYGCKDCGLGFADRADLKDHQKVHNREYLTSAREYTHSVIHTHSVSEYQRENTGEQLYECPACGESFVHSSFLFEHQKVHEQDPFYGQRRYDEPFLQPLVINPQRFRDSQKSPSTAMFLQCQLCGQDFIHGSVFNEHLALHMGEDSLDQGQRSGDALSPALPLTESQRSQTEEHYECETCGESFLTQADLRDHMRIHEKDEPYDYGASFVHTSFLTEPPKRDSPFYECKDCGKSFIHNTVLTKHQKLHLEEEEAAAQEVEANVLVPREVLRIQGSNEEAAEPEVEAAEPEVEVAEPNVEAAEPNGEAEGPEGEAAEPDGEAEQPNGEAEQPNGDADEPDGVGIEDPEERAEEPEGKAEEAEGDADEPDGAGIEDPEEEGEDQEIEVEEPYYDCRECGETFASNSAYGEHLKTHARVIIFEAGNGYGEGSRYTEHASPSTSDHDRADDKYFKCDVCGQLFGDRLSLARHQNNHTG